MPGPPERVFDRLASASLDRRSWLAVVASAALGAASRAEDTSPGRPDEDQQIKTVEELARKGGLKPLRTVRSPNYLGIGDAPISFLKLTLHDCEAIAADYFDHFRARGFELTRPEGRFVVVVLADNASFAAFLGTSFGTALGGIYERSTNRLVVFDYRPVGPRAPLRPGHANLLCLAHEATHQLTFNTGLIERKDDVPLCVIEGLAMYGEIRKFTGRTEPGQINAMRLRDAALLQRREKTWIELARLLTDDGVLRGTQGGGKRLLAYSESWLLVHYLMTGPSRLPNFRQYLAAIRGRRDPAWRLDDAREHLGDLDRLDQDLQQYSVRLLKSQS